MNVGAKIALRDRLSEAQTHRCAYCVCRFTEKGERRCTIEHYQAQSHGGKTTYENCVAACWRCNQSRKTQHPMAYFLARNPRYRGYVGSYFVSPNNG